MRVYFITDLRSEFFRTATTAQERSSWTNISNLSSSCVKMLKVTTCHTNNTTSIVPSCNMLKVQLSTLVLHLKWLKQLIQYPYTIIIILMNAMHNSFTCQYFKPKAYNYFPALDTATWI